VSFPDFPGVVTAGKSLDDARAMAEEALAFHIEGMLADGEVVPESPPALKRLWPIRKTGMVWPFSWAAKPIPARLCA
jgi:hypothetical protein